MIGVMGQSHVTDNVAGADHIFQARFPLQVVDWLRTQWYRRHVSMNSVIVEAVGALRGRQVECDTATIASDDDAEAQRFTVRLSGPDYDWLRGEAFLKRVSINKLLTGTLADLATRNQDDAPVVRTVARNDQVGRKERA